MKLLGVETSSPIFSVALCDGEQVLSCLKVGALKRPSLLLSDLVEKAALYAGVKLKDLDGFAVSIGPGSFTGLRVGVMTVKTLAWALKKPVLPVSSLEVIAQNLIPSSVPVCPFLDARKGKVYAALFSPDEAGGLRRVGPDRLLLPEDLLQKLEPRTILVGDALQRYAPLLSSLNGHRFTPAPLCSGVPSAEHLCRIAVRRWPDDLVDDPHRLVPQYLYSQESDITGW